MKTRTDSLTQKARGPTASPFTDTRILQAPVPVIFALLCDYLQKQGFQVDGEESYGGEARLVGTARNPAGIGTLFLRRKPGVVNFELNAERDGATQVRLQVSYGLKAELMLAFGTAALWIVLGVGWWWLLALRHEFLPGGRFSQISPVAPAFGFGMCLLAGFTCTWFTAFRLSKFVSTFYDYVSNESALHHYAESPLRLTGAAFVQVLIVNAGLLFISFSTLQVLPLREQIVLSGILLVLFAIATLLLLVGSGTIRWVVGHAAFTTGISCSLYVLLPLIIFGLSLEDVRRAAADPGLGWHQVGAILVIAFTVGLILKAVSNASSLAHNIDYWRNHVESHRWMTRWNRLALGLIALPVLVVTGSLALIAGGHSLLYLQSHLLGDYAWPHATGFDQAALTLGTLTAPIFLAIGLKLNSAILGNCLFSIYLFPVVVWCACHGNAFLREIKGYFTMLRLPALPADSLLHAAIRSQALSSRMRVPKLRIIFSPHLQAFAPIPPIAFLPQLIVISTGAIERLPPHCLVALMAHEMGHLRYKHTLIYTWLRLLSRALLLGPSLLTGLIKPAVVLEMQADTFATQWLETHGRSRLDLIETLRLLEQDRIAGLLSEAKQAGLAGHFDSDWLPPQLRRRLEDGPGQGWFQRLITGWRLLHFMTFESDLANYTYFSHTERARLITALPEPKGQV